MNLKPDAGLIADIQNGDILAFETLVRRYQVPLYRFAWRILRNEQDAQDVVQEALFNIYRHIDRIDCKKRISTYIFAVTKNAAYSLYRSKQSDVPLDEAVDIEADETVFEHLIRSDDAAAVRKAISALEEKYRRVVRLYYFDELAYEQISKRCKIPLNTVRTLLRRAKEKLRLELSYEAD
jgi:RNA polymerase sigma-70 factor, ECF subfamily